MISAEDLQQIVQLSELVPPEYRARCFEILLQHWLAQKRPESPTAAEVIKSVDQPKTERSSGLPVDVNAFLAQFHLEPWSIDQLFHRETGQVRPVYELRETTKSKAEIDYALLLALENAIMTGQFQITLSELRNRCQEEKCYDIANFMKHIRTNAALFKAINPGQPLALSGEGKAQLARLIERIIRQSQQSQPEARRG